MISGPPRSSYTPVAARVEQVMTTARGALTTLPSPRSVHRLRRHTDIRDPGMPVDRLHHVDDGEGRDADGGEGLHLDAGAVGCAHGGLDLDALVDDGEVHLHAVHRDGMREGMRSGCA